MPKPVRAFIAVAASQAVAQRATQLVRHLRDAAPTQVKWAAADQMHFTLKFLGEIELTESAAVCQAIARATAGHAPFELQVQGAGAFPSADRPRTLWLGVSQGAQALESLQGSIDAEMAKLGYRPEPRRFQGHLTIGRVKEGRVPPQLATVLAQWRDFDAGEMAVHDVRLYSSVLRPEGPLYEVMGRARLDAKNQAG